MRDAEKTPVLPGSVTSWDAMGSTEEGETHPAGAVGSHR